MEMTDYLTKIKYFSGVIVLRTHNLIHSESQCVNQTLEKRWPLPSAKTVCKRYFMCHGHTDAPHVDGN